MFAATGSTNTAATCSSSSGTTLYGTTMRVGHGAGRHAGRAGQTERGDTAAAGGEQRVGGAVEVAVEDDDAIAAGEAAGQAHRGAGGLGAGVHQAHALAAGHPRRRSPRPAAVSPGVGAPYDVPFAAAAVMAAVTAGCAWPRMIGAVALHEVDVAGALHVEHVRALGALDDVRRAAHRLERTDAAVDTAGDDRARAGEQLGVRAGQVDGQRSLSGRLGVMRAPPRTSG